MNHVFLLCLWIIPIMVYAESASFQCSYEQGKQLAIAQQSRVTASIENFQPETVFEHFTNHPKEANDYGGVQQKDNLLTTKALSESANNQVAQSLRQNFNNRPQFKVDALAQNMQTSRWMIEHAHDVVRGNMCKKIPHCETTYVKKTCQEQAAIRWFYCKKRLKVDVENKIHETHYPINIHLKSDRYYTGARINVVTGRVVDHGPHDSTAWVDGRLPTNIDCNTLQSTIMKTSIDRRFIDGIGFPACGNLEINIHVTDPNHRHRINGIVEIDIVSRRMDTKINDIWEDGCEKYANDHQCKLDKQQCTEQDETRIIGGMPITRTCWAHEAKYRCSATHSTPNACQAIREQGCEQIASLCHQQQDGQCLLYDQTFRCPRQSCSSSEQTICVKEPECINGDCSSHNKENDHDFNQAAGSFAAMVDAAKEMNKNNQLIFHGTETSCSKAPIGFLDCCTDSGWGDELFTKCSEQEKNLKHDKEKRLVVAIPGDYCANEVGGICLSKRKRYCVFTTKLARLIQEQGRRNQLHISFGTPDEPNCMGLSPEDLQRIDFSKIDFSEIMEEIKNNMPTRDQDVLLKRIKQRVDEMGIQHA